MKVVPRHMTTRTLQLANQSISVRSLSGKTSIMGFKAKFAEGSDEASLLKEVESLSSNRWAVTEDGQGIQRSFKFKTFAKTWVRQHPSPSTYQ